MNYLAHHTELNNRYYVMRHGESLANLAGIIISSPEHGILPDFGLSERGREQAWAAAGNSGLGPETVIFSSSFSRAYQTASITASRIGAEPPRFAEALNERHVGRLEGKSNRHYDAVWAYDALSADHTEFGVESVRATMRRSTAFILAREVRSANRDILLVSHGDTLQILQAAFEHVDPRLHRTLPHLETAEIRRLTLASVS